MNKSSPMEQLAHDRTAAVSHGLAHLPLADGPKVVTQIQAHETAALGRRKPLSEEDIHPLLSFMPSHIEQLQVQSRGDTWLASSAPDRGGRHSQYIHVAADRSIELVSVLAAGGWGNEARTWWPGAYELPLLKALSANAIPILKQLGTGLPARVFISLTDIAGTAIVTESDLGIECPFPLPAGIDSLHFAPVDLGETESCREALSTSFNTIREIVGLKNTMPFYF
ncbi:hypothetical protein PQQ51_32540 [Paraburkholderia xenovorans]|uniref:hypothetical protein n=1 Tax=Paraburkholderia xenovorans TaxID=36873 RepID=UPI0038B8772C